MKFTDLENFINLKLEEIKKDYKYYNNQYENLEEELQENDGVYPDPDFAAEYEFAKGLAGGYESHYETLKEAKKIIKEIKKTLVEKQNTLKVDKKADIKDRVEFVVVKGKSKTK
ncbi:hypothetical protein [Spiroplasma tabanidicola]|uniref:Uncharacterized protein n=1 Tax=Spiroplasma tabanidicola TaxID=324079 RepID=A0A6I6C6M6_9MOLU|nr:hypothetical protein [Spiroplasma tabanidicola]QGS51446.1 hypothetical protein STABA_v1c00790 [Spiroplasma tabanidicola]